MLEHSADGALGLVLNDPLDLPTSEALAPPIDAVFSEDALVHRGGPVEETAVIVLVEVDGPDAAGSAVVEGVQILDPRADPSAIDIRQARAFAGYSGWSPGQLEAEIAEESWIDATPTVGDVFCHDHADLWRRVVERKGGDYRLVARAPEDPSLN